jgi:hypothetical protein
MNMTIQDEFDEILRDIQHARFDDDTHNLLRERLRVASRAVIAESPKGAMFDHLAELLLLTFYTGREHALRGYKVLTNRDPGGIGQDEVGVPDDVSSLTDPPPAVSVDDSHRAFVSSLQSFLRDTATAGTLDTLLRLTEDVSLSATDLSAVIGEAEDVNARDEYRGWLNT